MSQRHTSHREQHDPTCRAPQIAQSECRGRGVRVADPDPRHRVSTFGVIPSSATPSVVARRLDERGIYVWNGNFYALNLVQRLGLDIEEGLLRIGFCHYNTVDEVDRVLDAMGTM